MQLPFKLNDENGDAMRKHGEVLLTILIASFILFVCYYLGVWRTSNNFVDDCTHEMKTTIHQTEYICSRKQEVRG